MDEGRLSEGRRDTQSEECDFGREGIEELATDRSTIAKRVGESEHGRKGGNMTVRRPEAARVISSSSIL